jgi:hypothetical protein
MTGWPEEDGIARSASGISVRRGVLSSEVGFIFDDTSSEERSSFAPNEQLTQQLASHGHWVAIEEFTRKYPSVPQHRSRKETCWERGLPGGIVAFWHRI